MNSIHDYCWMIFMGLLVWQLGHVAVMEQRINRIVADIRKLAKRMGDDCE